MSRFLGICPFLGVSKKIETALGMGMAVTFVMALASVITWVLQYAILEPLNIGYMQTIAFILVIAALVQLVEMIIRKMSPTLYQALGIFLPLITTNCAVLGVAILNITKAYTFTDSLINALGGGLGYTLSLFLFSGVRSKVDKADVPAALKGLPITLIAASLVAVSFFGFKGLVENLFS